MIGARNIVELPTVGVLALVLKHAIVSVEVLTRLWPVLNITLSSKSLSGVKWRTTEMASRISAPSVTRSTCTANQVAFHLVASDWAQNVPVFLNLLVVVDSSTDAHAILA